MIFEFESDRFPGRYIAVNPNRTMKIGSGGYHSNLWIKREGAKQQVIIQQPQQNYQPQVIVQQEMEQLRLQKQRQILDELQMKQMRLQNEASFKQQQQQLELEKLKMQQELEIQKQELELVKQKVMFDEQKIMLQQPQQNYSMFNDMPNDGWKTKNINEWTCKELQGWIRQLNHLGIVVQLQLIEEICNIKMSGKDFNSCITANDINNTFATISKTISNKVYKCLQQIRKNTYSPELVNDQNNNYNLLLEKYNQAMRDNNALKQNMINNENQLKTEISQLKQQNETHKRNYNNLKEIIRVISEQSASLQQMNLDQENKYNLLLHKCKKATNEVASLKQHILDYERDCNELTKQNCDLNDVCNKLKMELEDVKNKYNKCVEENSDYTRWDSDTITDWIININKQFIQYEKILRKQLKEEEITGNDLIHLNKNDLNRFGIKIFKHKQQIMEEIQKLIARQQNNNYNMQNDNDIIVYNEGKKETQYI